MSDIGEMLRHAYEFDDEARRDFEEYQERKKRDNPLLSKSAHQGLIYKTFEPRWPTTMSEENSRGIAGYAMRWIVSGGRISASGRGEGR